MMKRFILVLIAMLYLPTMVFADIIYLKSGKTVEGKLIEQTETAIKIVTLQGLTLTFYKDEIDHVEQMPTVRPPDNKLKEMTMLPLPAAVPDGEDTSTAEFSVETTTASETSSPPSAIPDQVDSENASQEEAGPESTGEPQNPQVSAPDLDAPEMVSPVTGILKGKTFVPGHVEIQDDIIAFKQEEGVALYIFLFLPKGESLENRKFSVIPETGMKSPHVHLKWKAESEQDEKTAALVSGYTMRLEFNTLEDGRLSGTIFIQLPEQYQTELEGTFEAQIL